MQWGKHSSIKKIYDKLEEIKNGFTNIEVQQADNFSLAYPKTSATIEVPKNEFGKAVQPTSIGYDDGAVYGFTNANNQIFRCTNSFETMTGADLEIGQAFSELEGSYPHISGVFKTHTGYVVVDIDRTNDRSGVWFSTNFESGFVKVLDMDRGRATNFNMFYQFNSELDSPFLVSEYKQGRPNPGMRLFMSMDGGQTWEVIKELMSTPINETQNIHWHHSIYDPYDGRIWASAGDGDNGDLHYSYDLGKTWATVPHSAYIETGLPSHQPQATLMIPTESKIVCGPDNGLRSGLISLIKDKKYTGTVENFTWELEYAVHPKTAAATLPYPTPFYAVDKNEFYVLCPSDGGAKFILGSGDAGRTWHKVATINLSKASSNAAPNGIVGVDKNGYMYVFIESGSRIAKIKKAEWIYS